MCEFFLVITKSICNVIGTIICIMNDLFYLFLQLQLRGYLLS